MDDIYFSDRKKRPTGDENSYRRRVTPDEFIDTDYFDESFELDFGKRGAGESVQRKERFVVNLPDEDSISAHIDRTPKGRPLSHGTDSFEPEVYKRHSVTQQKDIMSQLPDGNISQGGTLKSDIERESGEPMASKHNVNPRHSEYVPQHARAPQGRPVQTRTPQGARVNNPNAPKPVRMSRPDSSSGRRPPEPPKPAASRKLAIALSVVGVIVALVLGIVGYGFSVLNGLEYDDSIKENAYIDESKLKYSDDVVNILFLGSDARSEVEGQRADTMILFSIDKKHKNLKLTSFLRDTYIYIPSKKYKTKLNAAYSYGGTQLTMDTLEYNFGVRIDYYIRINFKVFRQVVDLLGGITVDDVSAKEAKYMREELSLRGVKKGTNTFNGKKALWYCRMRYVDNDFRRTQRQRKVISAIISKALRTNPFKLMGIVKEVLPNISTNIKQEELRSLAIGAVFQYLHYDMYQQQIPAEGTWKDARINGQAVLKTDIDENAKILKEFIYDNKLPEEKK